MTRTAVFISSSCSNNSYNFSVVLSLFCLLLGCIITLPSLNSASSFSWSNITSRFQPKKLSQSTGGGKKKKKLTFSLTLSHIYSTIIEISLVMLAYPLLGFGELFSSFIFLMSVDCKYILLKDCSSFILLLTNRKKLYWILDLKRN